MPNGYTGKILHVDLSSARVEVEQPDELFYRTYLGGRGFACWYLLKELPPGLDAFDPANPLVFAASVIVGAPVPATCRYTVAAKSPLTGAFAESEAGGWWGPELKLAGYDAIVVRGRAEKPVYLWIRDGRVEIRSAGHLWGLISGEAEQAIRSELDEPRARVALIGPAGENRVRYAGILNNLRHANGRTGMGAVMGSKNLKAVAVRGTARLELHDREALAAVARKVGRGYREHPLSRGLHDMGTSGGISALNRLGAFPTHNFRDGSFDRCEEISGERMTDTILVGREGCYACPIRCKRVVEITQGDLQVDPAYGGPEYETVAAFGSSCEVADLAVVAKAHELCNKFCLDTISAGVTISWAMECFEKGILTPADTGGLEIRFGDGRVVLELLERIARRQGFGDVLAEGVYRAAERVGRGSMRLAVQTKKMEAAFHDGRGKKSIALGYAVSPKGPDHLIAPFDALFESAEAPAQKSVAPLGLLEPLDSLDFSWKKVRQHVYISQLWSAFNCLGVCNFGFAPRSVTSLHDLVEIVRAVTGWDTSLWELMKAGERMIHLTRLINLRQGLTAADDTVPERFHEPMGRGPLEGQTLGRDELREAVRLYYEMMGWDEHGNPRRGKLLELGLDWAVDLAGADA